MVILRNMVWLSSDTVPLNPIYCYSVLRVLTNKTYSVGTGINIIGVDMLNVKDIH